MSQEDEKEFHSLLQTMKKRSTARNTHECVEIPDKFFLVMLQLWSRRVNTYLHVLY